SFQGTKAEAKIKAAQLIREGEEGYRGESAKTTVAAFLERWIEYMHGQVSPRSHERYAELCRKNISPLLGNVVLRKLQPDQIKRAYDTAQTSGRRDGKGGLSPRTVTHMHRVLREALQYAVRWPLLAGNPADAVKATKVERKQMATLDADDTAVMIEAARSSPLCVPILLGALCGLRRGEIAAVKWRSIDLETGRLSVVASIEQ